jgi:hypothetical protein
MEDVNVNAMNDEEFKAYWAKNLKAVVIETIEFGINYLTSDPRFDASDTQYSNALTLWQKRLENVKSCENPRAILDSFMAVSRQKEPMANLRTIMNEFKRSGSVAHRYFDK